jgi:hypothetical protein
MVKDMIVKDLRKEIGNLKQELLIAKSILRNPRLSQLATRKFNEVI